MGAKESASSSIHISEIRICYAQTRPSCWKARDCGQHHDVVLLQQDFWALVAESQRFVVQQHQCPKPSCPGAWPNRTPFTCSGRQEAVRTRSPSAADGQPGMPSKPDDCERVVLAQIPPPTTTTSCSSTTTATTATTHCHDHYHDHQHQHHCQHSIPLLFLEHLRFLCSALHCTYCLHCSYWLTRFPFHRCLLVTRVTLTGTLVQGSCAERRSRCLKMVS